MTEGPRSWFNLPRYWTDLYSVILRLESDAEGHLQQHNPSKALFPPLHDVVTDWNILIRENSCDFKTYSPFILPRKERSNMNFTQFRRHTSTNPSPNAWPPFFGIVFTSIFFDLDHPTVRPFRIATISECPNMPLPSKSKQRKLSWHVAKGMGWSLNDDYGYGIHRFATFAQVNGFCGFGVNFRGQGLWFELCGSDYPIWKKTS